MAPWPAGNCWPGGSGSRRAEVAADLPDVAELLALSVGAGENVAAALERVSAGRGPLCAQLRHSLGRVRTGTPLLDALVELAGRWGVAPFTRFVDGIAVAVESGSPLAEVLRAQAADAREAERRRLLETGGRREVQMMVPVVFGVLPVTVVFAVFPGLAQLPAGLNPTPNPGNPNPDRTPNTETLEELRVDARPAPGAQLDRPCPRPPRRGPDDRGDVPGWVLVTIMTAGSRRRAVGRRRSPAGGGVHPGDGRRRRAAVNGRPGDEGSAVAEFAAVAGLLALLFAAVVQLAVVQHVRATAADCAGEGARSGALRGQHPRAGGAAQPGTAGRVAVAALRPRRRARVVQVGGRSVVEVDVEAPLPVVGLLGAGHGLHLRGHALLEGAA